MTREFADGQVVPGTRYRVIGHLGSGGMGSVYLVEHTELGKQFVLKALFRDLASRKDLVARLRQEWRALGRLDHPNIVNVTDAGTTDDNQPYYVMERVEGETLAALLNREQAISIPRAVHVAAAVLDALSAAHEIGIVHRDVKPPNIFVTSSGAVKLLDFGVAKLADSSAEVITARGVAIGTPRYMSPEQAKGKSVDARADLYAVGLVLYECIAGVGPFDEAKDANELLLFHLSKDPPRLSTFHRGVKPELDDVVASLLAKDPAARPGSAQQVARALRALVKRRSLPPTRGATPDAGYDAVTGGAESVVMPSTRPDGVAGRRSEPPTVDLSPQPPGSTTVIMADATLPASGIAPDTDQATAAGLDWAKDGFDTLAADAVPATVGNTSTMVSAPPSSAVLSSTPLSRDRTQPIEGFSPPPPNEVETRTSVPAVPPASSVTTLSGETPPPVHSDSIAAPTRGRGSSGPVVVALVVAALLTVVGIGFFAARSLRAANAPAAAEEPAVEVVPAAAPSAAPSPEPAETVAEPAAPAPSEAAAPEPAAPVERPVAQPARQPAAQPAEKPAEKPVEKPAGKPAAKPATRLPASGL